MQSQQKKVKWSRGETADALEERTDTGITQVSVSLLQNIIADVYGNISRRPAFQMVPYAAGVEDNSTIVASTRAKMVPFKISKDDFVIFVFPNNISLTQWFSFYRVRHNRIVYVGNQQFNDVPITTPTGYAQNNNYLILACPSGNVKIQATNIEEEAVEFTFEKFEFSGTWYTDGAIQNVINNDIVPGLAINQNQDGFVNITISSNNGIENNMYSAVTTGIKNTAENYSKLIESIPVGSIVTFPNMGGQLRVEGIIPYVSNGSSGLLFPNTIFDGVLNGGSVPSIGTYCRRDPDSFFIMGTVNYEMYVNGKRIKKREVKDVDQVVRCRASSTGFSRFKVTGLNKGHWEEYPAGNLYAYIYGEILSPITNKQGIDTQVTVLSGYEELSSENSMFRTTTFSNQRLYTGGLTSTQGSMLDHGALVVGSQIAKYNDFKNNYGTPNEAVTIDVATKAQEQVFHVVDYNGLQILTDVAEYSYRDGAPIKQSDNGTLKDCIPLVFNNTMLYADRSKRYIRVAQYQLQTNVFGSTKINSLAKEDLIHNPVSLSFYEEKENSTGTFLFVINDPTDKTFNAAELAVCNMLPENQEVIWTRWDSVSFPYTYTTTDIETTTIRYAWRNQNTGVTTYTALSKPSAGDQLYKADGTDETQFYTNKVEYYSAENAISVVATRTDTQQDFYAWYVAGDTYYTTSATPSVDDPLYYKQDDDTFVLWIAPYNKVWAVGTNQITVQPQMYYWEGNYSGAGQYFYNKYWSTSSTPQVGDTVYGYEVYPVTHDGTYPAPFTVTAVSGSTITIERINVDNMDTLTIVATRTSGPQDKSAVVANRQAADDETATLVTYTNDVLARFPEGDIQHTETTTTTHSGETSIICDSVTVDNKVFFLCGLDRTFRLAQLNFERLLDFETPVIENKYKPSGLILEGATVQVYDDTEYKFDATVGADGTLSVDTTGLEHPHAGFWINAKLESHPLDVGGRTYTDKKRIGKAVAVVRDTKPGAFTVCDKTGYMAQDKKTVNFYGCTGMKYQVRYTIKNIQGAKFTIESLTMIIEYATLDS